MSKKKRSASTTASITPPPPASSAPTETMTPDVAVSADPRRRLIANLTLIGLSLYVAMIWLLALDQQFHWGIFKP